MAYQLAHRRARGDVGATYESISTRHMHHGRTEAMRVVTASPGWTIMRDDRMSTSAVPSPHVHYWGFGSTSGGCTGIGYALQADRFDLYLSAPCAIADELAAFATELPRAVGELDALLGADG